MKRMFCVPRRFDHQVQNNVAKFLGDLRLCIKTRDIEQGRAIHAALTDSGEDLNTIVANTLINMYIRCGSTSEAKRHFDKMTHRDVVSYNSLILGYVEYGEGQTALNLFEQMQTKGTVPNGRTFVAALKACGALAFHEQGRDVGGKVVKFSALERGISIQANAESSGFCNMYVCNMSIDLYAKCGSLLDARRVFDKMSHHDIVSWNALMFGCSENGEAGLGLELFENMQLEPNTRSFAAALKAATSLASKEKLKVSYLERGRAIHATAVKLGYDTDVFVANLLVELYAACGSLGDAQKAFKKTQTRDIVSWTTMVTRYAENGEEEMALELFTQMHDQLVPNSLTFVAVLKACGGLAAVEYTKAVHGGILKLGLETDKLLLNSLIDVYGKCSSVLNSQKLFDSLSSLDAVTWTSLIAGYSCRGETQSVFRVFQAMVSEGCKPNAVTFVWLLTACSYGGEVSECTRYFEMMHMFGVKKEVQHYTCLIDGLARTNHLDRAAQVAWTMPYGVDAVTLRVLLSSCRKWKNVGLGKVVFEKLIKLDEKDVSAYMLMGSLYGSVGMTHEQQEVEVKRSKARAWKKMEPGRSWWTDNEGRVHTFRVADTKHPQSLEIREKINSVLEKIKQEHGYIANLGSLVPNYNNNNKRDDEEVICGHSERLAVGCALINTREGGVIRILKNLRTCEDCHKVIGMISRIEQREIVCRDASRFHVYKDGVCSCKEQW